MPSTSTKLRKPPHSSRSRSYSFHWLFRTNIPRKRGASLPNDIHKRNFFGMADIIGVLANPAEAVRSLTESRRLLDEARREIAENRERSQLRTKHTFSRVPGFFPRQDEVYTIERALEGEPSFTVLYGASSVGKTALLREVLSRDAYHVLHFDLRIAGFADMESLYISLSQQMEQYFEEIARTMDGYGEFEKEAWSFKHDRINVERRLSDGSVGTAKVKTSDIVRLMELFQSSLLAYWKFQPDDQNGTNHRRQDSDAASSSTHVEFGPNSNNTGSKRRWGFRRLFKGNAGVECPVTAEGPKEKEKTKAVKKIPVFFFDEAHKLPKLIQNTEAMKCLLDSMLVLTKQDRLCHVIHATSDPFYQTWLRQLNVMQHCKIITIGDCTKTETRAFFRERMLPRVPERLQAALDFEQLYFAFGGKLVHWQDYITDYVNSNGTLGLKHCSHFLQAHSLLNLHIIHSSQSSSQGEAVPTQHHNNSSTDAIHPGLGPAGFKTYAPTMHELRSGADDDRANAMIAGYYSADFTAMQLLKVMSRLTQPDVTYLPYFLLCREMGVRAVDGMIKGRVLDLRWTETVSREGVEEERPRRIRPAGSSGTAVDQPDIVESTEGGDMVAVPEGGVGRARMSYYEEPEMVVGPKLLPVTPMMRFAMREVVQEYEDTQSMSEYASLSDVDEY